MQLLLSPDPELLRNEVELGAAQVQVVECEWTMLTDDTSLAAHADAAVAISYARYLAESNEWNQRNAPWTVVIGPADELLDVAPELLARKEILVSFPAYTDGRGYSHAATLRQHHDYTGGLIAVGDIRRDQLDFMRHCGFTAFEITGNDSVEDMLSSLSELVMPESHRLYSGAAL